MSRAPNGRLAPPGVRVPGAVDAPRHRRPASPIDHPRRPARGAATSAGRPGPRSGLPPWSPRRVRDRSDAHGERAASVSRFALNEVAHGGASARAEPGNPHIALRFRRNVLRPGENHRVTCATREYRVRARRRSRPPSLRAGVTGRSSGLSPPRCRPRSVPGDPARDPVFFGVCLAGGVLPVVAPGFPRAAGGARRPVPPPFRRASLLGARRAGRERRVVLDALLRVDDRKTPSADPATATTPFERRPRFRACSERGGARWGLPHGRGRWNPTWRSVSEETCYGRENRTVSRAPSGSIANPVSGAARSTPGIAACRSRRSILRALSPRGGVGPFRLAAGEILREPAVRFDDAPDRDAVFPGFPGGGGERLFRAGGLATEERGVGADRPPALPEPVERRTEPDDIAADSLAEARPLSPVGSRWRSGANRARRRRRRSRSPRLHRDRGGSEGGGGGPGDEGPGVRSVWRGAFLPVRTVRAPVASDPPTRPGHPGAGLPSLASSPSTFGKRPGSRPSSGWLRRRSPSGWTRPVLAVCVFGTGRLGFRLL